MTFQKFSIIIPAHNEEKYIGRTIKSILSLDYPKQLFEAVIVENGSTDKTYEIAKQFARKNIRVFANKWRGVSKARNFGAEKASKQTKWLIFLDADTSLGRNFLKELNTFLNEKSSKYLIGTTEINPDKPTAYHKTWFKAHNMIHKIFKLSLAIQIVNKKFFNRVKYDEKLPYSEDIKLIREMSKHGLFFYVPTKNVITSTRRFDKEGHLRLLIKWGIINNLPYKLRTKRDYEVIR